MTASPPQQHSCIVCARRKVKCDRLNPCSNCSRNRSKCIYRAPTLSQRHRKRPADEDILSKIREYEDLLRRNNVEFQPLDNLWIPSPLEDKLGPVPRPRTAHPSTCAPLRTPTEESSWSPEAPGSRQQRQADLPGAQSDSETAQLWYGLPKELRDTAIDQLKRPGKDPEDEEDAVETSLGPGISISLVIPSRPGGAPRSLELHPDPKHMFKLWQAFAENANPLTKVVHSPSLQQRILEVSWNLESVTRPLEAVMFAVYSLAIVSMKSRDCVQTFGETRSVLLNRYRSGAAQALAAAELHSTRDLEVLQAFVLFLLFEPRSELSVTLVAMATRIGHKMGLHRTGTDPEMPFFEQEMRLRVWWQIIRLESRARRKGLGLPLFMADYGDVRLPLNVNDAELYPQMAGPPTVEHAGATEMLYCLMKYEIPHYVRSSVIAVADATRNPYELVASTGPETMARKRQVLADLERIYEEKYLCHCDPRIPLHHISATVARLTIHRVRFWCYHPRHQPGGGRVMSQAELDIAFESSVRLLQLDYDVRAANFSAHLLEHLLVRTEVEALVYMVSELRHRVAGDLVRDAWALVGRVYEDYPQLMQDTDKFYTALADLTLRAWEARRQQQEEQPVDEAHAEIVPGFIEVLQAKRRDVEPEPEPELEFGEAPAAVMAGSSVPDEGLHYGFTFDDDPLDWVYWNQPLQL